MNDIERHYKTLWGQYTIAPKPDNVFISEIPSDFEVLIFSPSESGKLWRYATSNLSSAQCNDRIELHIISNHSTPLSVEILYAISHYHFNSRCLNIGHTVNLGMPWDKQSSCTRALISLPYMDGPDLEWISDDKSGVRFLWLVPITEDELIFAKLHGITALEDEFEAKSADLTKPERSSVIS